MSTENFSIPELIKKLDDTSEGFSNQKNIGVIPQEYKVEKNFMKKSLHD